MPQMAPIGWLSLFIIFSIAFVIFNMMNYYSFIPSMPKSNLINKNQQMNSLNWKW
uniref:ATP synthase complex subunit 8 n=1 Tax=Scathophaga stercoraria TaxID=95463 RepID=A0A0U1X739_SCAST|nr:ATP synthase F0 subunit 8 [Scathophaga stercoraria]AIL95201.1 ATP synthase F0 subunit 8 [Scathophaga stercoraria]UJG45478.1 ATP synthase F0 subunit 8 [Scathophaga stercoraria]